MPTAREKLANAPPPQVHTLDDAKAARLKGRTMLIPSPIQVRDAIAAIPCGQSKTVLELRSELAMASGADVTCPRAASIAWGIVAEAAEEARANGDPQITPWWRLTRDRKPDRNMPGGIENHRALLASEGIRI